MRWQGLRGVVRHAGVVMTATLVVVSACSRDEGSTGDGDATGGDANGNGAGGQSGDGDGDGDATGGITNGAGGLTGDGDGDLGGGGAGTGGAGDSPPSVPEGCFAYPDAPSAALYVAPDGNDTTGDGSIGAPFATIDQALSVVTDGGTILVRPGEYVGRVRLDEVFDQGVSVRSEVPYQARLRNDEVVVTSYYGEGITFEGFDVAHSGPGGALVVQIQNLREDGGATGRIVLLNNVFHDSYDNDIVKVNNAARDVSIIGNMFYNQAGSDEHIDANSVENVIIERNVFFNDFSGSGRTNGNDTSSFVVIKDSNGDSDGILGATDVTVRGNVFLNWEGNTGAHFVLIGEDGTANYEAQNVSVESNLMLGNSANEMRAAFGVKGSRDVRFIGNTVVGDLPSLAFAFRLNREGENPMLENIVLANNVWSDPTGTMDDFSDTPAADTSSFILLNNAYYNGGQPLPEDANELVNPTDDAAAIGGDPELTDPEGVVLPRWVPDEQEFADGSFSICEVHRKLAEEYAAPGGTLLRDAADPDHAPETDILGRQRSAPDVGAWEGP